MYMLSYTHNLELLYQTPEELSVELAIPKFLKEVLRKAFDEGRDVLNLPEAFQFLETYQIPTIKTLVAKTSSEAEAAASKLGCPIVMKVLSPQITHKSKAEGVILNVWSPSEARLFFDELAKKVTMHNSTAEFQGAIIQPMIHRKGYELLIGSKKDPQFGSVIVFGMGGVAAEVVKDASIGFPPLNQVLARRLMERTAIYRHAETSGSSFNIKLLEEILVKFSQLVIDFPEVKEIDINPLIVDENTALAVDARIVLDGDRILQETQPYEHLVIAPYPKEYITQWQLKDGTPVTLRPIKPEDETLFHEMFKSLSEETMRFRFFEIIKELPHETLTRYCNLDYDREIAIVAELQKERKIIGAARLVSEPGGKCGEFAVVVADQWQRLGLGAKLTDYIIAIGRENGLEKIYGYVSSNNFKMIQLCTKLGFQLKTSNGEILATLHLSPPSTETLVTDQTVKDA
jgi:acetyltransferase